MTRRYRLRAGVFTLLALSLSFVEAGLTSVCAAMPDMAMDATDMAAAPAVQHGHAMAGGSTSGSTDGSGDPQECPYGPAATAQGCPVAASLPSSAVDMADTSTQRTAIVPLDAASHGAFLPDGLFHPPRV